MSVRRRQHAYSESDIGSSSAILQIDLHLNTRGQGRNTPNRITRPVHPRMTTFGPQTLAEFVRNQINEDRPVSSQDKGKGRAKVTGNKTTKAAKVSARDQTDGAPGLDIKELLARDAMARESIKPARVGLAPNALQNLRGKPGTSNRPTLIDPVALPEEDAPKTPKKRRSQRLSRRKGYATDNTEQENKPEPKPEEPQTETKSELNDTASDGNNDNLTRWGTSWGTPASNPPRVTGAPTLQPSLSTVTQSPPRFRRRRGGSGSRAPAWASTVAQVPRAPASRTHTASAHTPRNHDRYTAMYSRLSRGRSQSATDTLMEKLLESDSDLLDQESSEGKVVQNPAPTAIVDYDYGQSVPTATPDVVVTEHNPQSPVKRKRPTADRIADRFMDQIADRIASAAGAAPDDDDGDSSDSDLDDFDLPFSDFGSPGSDSPFNTGSANTKKLSISNDTSSRPWRGTGPPVAPGAPPQCRLPPDANYSMPELPSDIWIAVTAYLSLTDLHALRLVCRDISNVLPPIQYRNLVVPFGADFREMCANPGTSVLARHGDDVGKFGISFEYDMEGLAFAPRKASLETEHAWYGSYRWPAQQYHHYEKLKTLEDLVDNNSPVLNQAFGYLQHTHELGLSIDSGHGWLEGPDMSDLALFKLRQTKGTRVFGQAFENEHAWQAYGQDEYFKWAQQNTINKLLTYLASKPGTTDSVKMLEVISAFHVRERDSFTDTQQPDYNPDCHTGGRAPPANIAAPVPGQGPPGPQMLPFPGAQQLNQMQQLQALGQWNQQLNPQIQLLAQANQLQAQANQLQGLPPAAPNQQNVWAAGNPQLQNMGMPNLNFPPGGPLPPQVQALQPPPIMGTGPVPTLFGRHLQDDSRRSQRSAQSSQPKIRKRTIPLQWPLIFNGHNLAAETGGCLKSVQACVASPTEFPILPGCLTEQQVQWLMETVWAQRTFLSAYTNATINNATKLRHVHTLTIAKLSSGLLPSLDQPKFWDSLPSLRRLTLLVAADWRKEHQHQNVYVQRASLISPVDSVEKFAEFLQKNICRLEKLFRATFGWAGGGEHAIGICARNQHLMPAPIIRNVDAWISDHDASLKGDPGEMLKFEHLCDLTFENCWFSPYMLETFMRKSHDTSLRTLTLNSVSMLVRHSTAPQMTASMTTIGHRLACAHDEENWLQEVLPASATWTEVLDRITPGKTLEELKYDANLIDREEHPMPPRAYRGRLQRIVLNSCGYAYVNVPVERFHQRELVWQPQGSTDPGLSAREAALRGRYQILNDTPKLSKVIARYGNAETHYNKNDRTVDLGPVMLGYRWGTPESNTAGATIYRGLGTLTQCVHPIEKRVLEHAWGMRFGWGDTLERWAAVEDNQLEGGTGRFSGVLVARGLEEDDE
jgi:hypothetical protein